MACELAPVVSLDKLAFGQMLCKPLAVKLVGVAAEDELHVVDERFGQVSFKSLQNLKIGYPVLFAVVGAHDALYFFAQHAHADLGVI